MIYYILTTIIITLLIALVFTYKKARHWHDEYKHVSTSFSYAKVFIDINGMYNDWQKYIEFIGESDEQ